MKRTTTTQEDRKTNSLNVMLEGIRDSHIDIVPIILDKIDNIFPKIIEEIVSSVYENMVGVGNE